MEPSGVSDLYSNVRPLDVATETINGTLGLDIAITPSPDITDTTGAQEDATADNLRSLEMKKWRGSASVKEYKHQPEDRATRDYPEESYLPAKAGAQVVDEMLSKGIRLVPAAIDG